MTIQKEKYRDYWTKLVKSQNNMETHAALNKEYTVTAYLTTASVPNLRTTSTKLRLSEHNLAVEGDQHGCPENRGCVLTVTGDK